MSNTLKFWGVDALRSDHPGGAIGVTINGRDIQANAYEAAQRVAAAGERGLSVFDNDAGFGREHMSVVATAGIPVREIAFGTFVIDALPEPTGYIQRDFSEPASKPTYGQFGSSGIPHDPYSRR